MDLFPKINVALQHYTSSASEVGRGGREPRGPKLALLLLLGTPGLEHHRHHRPHPALPAEETALHLLSYLPRTLPTHVFTCQSTAAKISQS